MKLMMLSPDERKVRNFVGTDGAPRTSYDYFGKSSGRDFGPQGFLVTVEDRTLPSHFHDVDQYQILLGVPGSFYQRHEIAPLMIHYADAYSTYGPIVGGNPPLRFFTLRADPTDFTGIMPSARDRLLHRGRRQSHFSISTDSSATDSETEVLLSDDADGLAAVLMRSVTGAAIDLPSPSGSKGQFVYVISGEVEWDERSFGPESLGWQSADDGPRQLRCLADSQILVLRFPCPATNARLTESAQAKADA